MKEPIYKAEFKIKPFYLGQFTKDIFGMRVVSWLMENDRQKHLVNIYTTDDPGHMIVVLNDRTTAIMLKLALT